MLTLHKLEEKKNIGEEKRGRGMRGGMRGKRRRKPTEHITSHHNTTRQSRLQEFGKH